VSTYEILDWIADLVNPVLGIVALTLPWLRRPARVRQNALIDALTLAAVAIAYCGQALDAAFHTWPRMGLDYSTHTAVFVASASSVWQHGRGWRLAAIGVGTGYAALMLLQKYHSLLDIASTAAAVLPPIALLWLAAQRLMPATLDKKR
jgi:hypothetical protein